MCFSCPAAALTACVSSAARPFPDLHCVTNRHPRSATLNEDTSCTISVRLRNCRHDGVVEGGARRLRLHLSDATGRLRRRRPRRRAIPGRLLHRGRSASGTLGRSGECGARRCRSRRRSANEGSVRRWPPPGRRDLDRSVAGRLGAGTGRSAWPRSGHRGRVLQSCSRVGSLHQARTWLVGQGRDRREADRPRREMEPTVRASPRRARPSAGPGIDRRSRPGGPLQGAARGRT